MTNTTEISSIGVFVVVPSSFASEIRSGGDSGLRLQKRLFLLCRRAGAVAGERPHVVGLGAGDVNPPDGLDVAFLPCEHQANIWESIADCAEIENMSVLVCFDPSDLLFDIRGAARAVASLKRSGAGMVLPSGFVGGIVPTVLTRDALRWAISYRGSPEFPMSPVRLIEEKADDAHFVIRMTAPNFLNRPDLRITDSFLSKWEELPPDNGTEQEYFDFYESLIDALDSDVRTRLADQCVRLEAQWKSPAPSYVRREKSNILFLSYVSAALGGAERSLLYLMRNLDRDRFKATLVCPSEGALVNMAAEAGADVVALPLSPTAHGPSAYLSSAGNLAALIREREIALVHANTIYTPQMGMLPALICGVPILCHVRELAASPVIFNNAMLPACSKIIAVSNAVRDSLIRLRVPEDRIEVVYNGVDLSRFRPGIDPASIRGELELTGGPVVVMTAQMIAWKGHDTFLRAAALVRKSFADAQFVVVGGEPFVDRVGGHKASLERLAESLGILGSVHFLGERRDIPDILAAANVFVHASLLPDPFPRTVIEAMACGLPVVGANSGGVPEALDNGAAGLLFPPGDAEALTNSIMQILSDSELSNRIGKTSRERAERMFDIRQHAKRVESIYDQVLKG